MLHTTNFLFFWIFIMGASVGLYGGVKDTPFFQEFHKPYSIGEQTDQNDVRSVVVDHSGNVWAATRAGVFILKKDSEQWTGLMDKDKAGPTFCVSVDSLGTVWLAAWNGIYRSTTRGLEKVESIDQPISALVASKNQIIAIGPDGTWRYQNGTWKHQDIRYSRAIRAILPDKQNGFWIATGMGLVHQTDAGVKLYQSASELLSADIHDLAFDQNGRLWIGGLGGVTVYKDGKRINHFTPKEGIPSVVVHSVIPGPDGMMWVGTDRGVARFDGIKWSLRHSRRWLLSDDVRDVAFDKEGTAWIATSQGVSAIKRRKMTLADKAEYFLRICYARHVREPYLVEKCRLTVPGDTTTWEPRDDDNDGQYTSMYLAMESFLYAATQNPQAKANTKKAFEALRFLQTVTETSGFVARTVIPSTWTRMADPNRTYTDQERADIRVHNPREKKVENHWRPSKDGKWLWKGDTSSDEITGHMFGYLFYYDLAADKKERKRVSEHVCRIVDYIIEDGYVLKDIDGTHTTWAVWSPEKLNHDPDWAAERGINSVEILSYLKLAYHMSGNERYRNECLKLLHEHNYSENVRRAKTFNPSCITHIDDELLALAYPCLLLHEDDPQLRRLYRESLDFWYSGIEKDCSPYFNFTYGVLTGQNLNSEVSIGSLRDTPLDLVRWRVDNTQREDIQLVRYPELESIETSRLLPPSERALFRWDKNPWHAIQGDGGHTESDGVFWLLSYWMGRYYGFIEPPQ